jgi:hypothetical protein
MTVAQLIQTLQMHPMDANVVVDDGDNHITFDGACVTHYPGVNEVFIDLTHPNVGTSAKETHGSDEA